MMSCGVDGGATAVIEPLPHAINQPHTVPNTTNDTQLCTTIHLMDEHRTQPTQLSTFMLKATLILALKRRALWHDSRKATHGWQLERLRNFATMDIKNRAKDVVPKAKVLYTKNQN